MVSVQGCRYSQYTPVLCRYVICSALTINLGLKHHCQGLKHHCQSANYSNRQYSYNARYNIYYYNNFYHGSVAKFIAIQNITTDG